MISAQVIEAIRRHVHYERVLDDRKALLKLLENTKGACEQLVEWKVSSRNVELKDIKRKATAWDQIEQGRNVCETLRGLK